MLIRRCAAIPAALILFSSAACLDEAVAADAAAGKKKAQTRCAICHGIDGIAKIPDAPNLAGESAIYTTRQLNAFRSGERKHEQMSIIAQGLDDADIADLTAWFASLKVTVEMPQ